MPAADAVIVESSPTEKLSKLTPEQHKTWRTTGELPAEKPAETPNSTETETAVAASSTAAEKEVAAPTKEEVPADSATAVVEPKSKPKPGAETRIKDLLAENKKLAQQLEDARKSQPAPAKKTDALAKPGRNDVDDKGQPKFADDDAWLEARDKWIMEESSRSTRETIAKEQRDADVAKQNELVKQRVNNNVKIATERHPDFSEVMKVETKDGVTTFNAPGIKAIKTGGVLDAWCLDSDAGLEILYHLAPRPEEVDRLQALNAFQMARELTKLEDRLSGTPASKTENAATAGSPADKKEKVPPAPATLISGKNAATIDEIAKTVEKGDFKRFQQLENEAAHRQRKAS